MLGALERVVIGGALWIAGAALVVPVAVITFAAAFVPFVGAVVAGLLAVAVTLATAGPGPALAVAVVAILVQQFDNDLLAPVIFGGVLDLHPAVILLVIASGGALAGLMGALLAVPVAAVILNSPVRAGRRRRGPAAHRGAACGATGARLTRSASRPPPARLRSVPPDGN